ncbi:MAG: hypothetical protein DWQ04_34790 [Chloroflexi bacterium]|nr:MAG: hypothetical protein DWQ04_34790 [Chloroflexota bacterium]
MNRLHYLFWLWLLLIISGCAMVQPVPVNTPTSQPTTMPPTALPPQILGSPVPIPLTFTPLTPDKGEDSTPEPTNQLVVLPTNEIVVATPTPSATIAQSEIIPDFLLQTSTPIPFLEILPRTVDCDGAGLLFRGQFPSEVGNPLRNYHAYLPPCYGEDGRSYPVLYLFHGSIQNDAHWTDLGLMTHMEAGLREGGYPPFMVIMPDNGEIGNVTSGNDNSIEGITVNELIPFVDERFCTWQDRAGRSIGGISRGGYWALMIAFRHEGVFTAVSGHSSHLRYETDRAEYNPLSTYADADLSNMNIWLDWGETDFLRTGQEQLRDALQEIDTSLDVHVNGGGHNDEYWLVHLREYLDWHASQWPQNRLDYPSCGDSQPE